jgi:cyclopropane fatty-acyl-phospholipid synthase-like methyltransferase
MINYEKGLAMPSTSNSADLYNREYFLKYCEGCTEINSFDGTNPPLRLRVSFEKAHPKKGERVLDLGSGRGELSFYAAYKGLQVWGVDYSKDAIEFAEEIRNRLPYPECKKANFRWTKDWSKEFSPESFDIIYLCDIVEHVYPHELDEMLKVAYRYLAPGGRIVIHTHPNRFMGGLTRCLIKNKFLQSTIFKLYARLLGMKSLNASIGDVHVNEQSVGSLRAALAKTPFEFRVWCEHFISPEQKRDFRSVIRKIVFFGWPITATRPLNLIFANDIWAVGVKPAKK